eukprot:758957-Amphidinium_carterae.1
MQLRSSMRPVALNTWQLIAAKQPNPLRKDLLYLSARNACRRTKSFEACKLGMGVLRCSRENPDMHTVNAVKVVLKPILGAWAITLFEDELEVLAGIKLEPRKVIDQPSGAAAVGSSKSLIGGVLPSGDYE